MSISLLRRDSNTDVANFLDNMFSNTFLPQLFSPARTASSSNTLLDYIFTNNYDANFTARNLVTTISDHLRQFLICLSEIEKLKTETTKNLPSHYRDYNNMYIHKMLTYLKSLD